MIYVRKLFTQDLRDGKQIAFPKEPSVAFFGFNYQEEGIEDRRLSFTYVSIENDEFDGTVITTRIYACSSESRIDGELKAFLRDKLVVSVDDLVVFKSVGNKNQNYTFSVVRKNDANYDFLLSLYQNANHSVSIDIDCPRSSEVVAPKKSVADYLSAIRTKPFLLLAGISGTGKSRIVKELAYSCCPNVGDLRSDPTSPGNYCLVEVKPNWNDSTELLGYETVLEGGGYHLTKFVKFVVKAMRHKDVPFFVCLDEMNLAPVEQYFAEFLSVLESRKDVEVNGVRTIQSEPLIEAGIFEKYENRLFAELFLTKDEARGEYIVDEESPVYVNSVYAQLKREGLRIPRNLIVVGTVNMDDTTYQFSRKVIDRAMTIEMNEVNLDKMLDTDKADALSYTDNVVDKSWFFAPFAQSDKALPVMDGEERAQLVAKIKETIGQTGEDGTATDGSLEKILGKTPFRIAYRVVNELILHFYALRWQNAEADFAPLYNEALDNILMMKVLPRIEGNEDVVKQPLTELLTWTQGVCPKSHQKTGEMLSRLESSHFTSFWP